MQSLIVLSIVAFATVYSFWKLMPKALRSTLARRGTRWVQRAARLSSENARRLEAKLATGGACGSCDSCNACKTPSAEKEAFAFIPIYKSR